MVEGDFERQGPEETNDLLGGNSFNFEEHGDLCLEFRVRVEYYAFTVALHEYLHPSTSEGLGPTYFLPFKTSHLETPN